ncbi:hypothetical protein PPYR_08208 [Photinus pyralis]|uniref:Protein kinase domain-containing protein n=1 Tax=Photinus pyralis TaxID=7054 RepID=A0A5N4AIS5_PHOPY|nr:uncharacterized protein LOC116170467 [Photinus pyralis]KAB0797214.1 hypothetical protein PPYR_08208 [Photinus pyralis]
MEFDLSKENIQPLRGGRNASRLGVALQAQGNEEFQRELISQKEKFENLIRNYQGNDPLENWYQYICWIEQSYPKHGHEGNLVQVLEDCLTKFENEKCYMNDFRLCKLWIKYNDLQPNPVELYQMMHSKGLCKGCADLYRAWAYYYEAAGDYRSADSIFQLGRSEYAQPQQELIMAHQNMIFAAGQQVISGVNEQRLLEQRHALTTLCPYAPGKVGSERSISSAGPGIVPSTSSSSRSNIGLSVYEDRENSVREVAAPPSSILSVAKRQIAPKENAIKAGMWTAPHLKGVAAHTSRIPKFQVHVDSDEKRGLILPAEFYPTTHEDFSCWKPVLCYAEPDDPHRFPMYPKAKVYCNLETEFSIEEIRAARYLPRSNVSYVETAQAIQSILGDGVNTSKHRMHDLTQEEHLYDQGDGDGLHHMFMSGMQGDVVQQPILQNHNIYQQFGCLPEIHQEVVSEQSLRHMEDNRTRRPEDKTRIFGQNMEEPLITFHTSAQNKIDPNNIDFGNEINDLWGSAINDTLSVSVHPPQHKNVSKFSIYEESKYQDHLQPKGSAMKSAPFKVLSDEDLAETGSRGGHDIAAAAQPGDEAKRIVIFEDESSSSMTEMAAPPVSRFSDLNATCNTQAFNFNLNAMKVSTPQAKQVHISPTSSLDAPRKQLFSAEIETGPVKLGNRCSTIVEETSSKSYGSSSGGSIKSNTFNNSKRENMAIRADESSSYHFNLAQNLRANAALRTSVLEVMDCESGQNSPVTETPIAPLETAPSDPFKPALLKQLLNRVGFPGRYDGSYIQINSVPRITVRKEVTVIGEDKYLVNTRLGEGTYGQVYKALDLCTNRAVALKLQKPPNCWEYYICKELQVRLAKHPLKECFMDIQLGYFSDQISVFVSEFCPSGSLLDVVNSFKRKTGYTIKQSVCMYFCIEMLKIVSAMHKAKIIHADIKPDNFLVYITSESTLQLQLIDFGCSIDMTLFPPGTSFQRRITTKDFICCEMQDGRPWSYHTDLFCVAATVHVLLFDKYMQLQKNGAHWSITQRFSRYMRQDLWNEFFSRLLNQQDGPANPDKLVEIMNDGINKGRDELNMEMRKLVNILSNR